MHGSLRHWWKVARGRSVLALSAVVGLMLVFGLWWRRPRLTLQWILPEYDFSRLPLEVAWTNGFDLQVGDSLVDAAVLRLTNDGKFVSKAEHVALAVGSSAACRIEIKPTAWIAAANCPGGPVARPPAFDSRSRVGELFVFGQCVGARSEHGLFVACGSDAEWRKSSLPGTVPVGAVSSGRSLWFGCGRPLPAGSINRSMLCELPDGASEARVRDVGAIADIDVVPPGSEVVVAMEQNNKARIERLAEGRADAIWSVVVGVEGVVGGPKRVKASQKLVAVDYATHMHRLIYVLDAVSGQLLRTFSHAGAFGVSGRCVFYTDPDSYDLLMSDLGSKSGPVLVAGWAARRVRAIGSMLLAYDSSTLHVYSLPPHCLESVDRP